MEFPEEGTNKQVKKYIYLFISNISLFIVFPLIRLISKSFYEKKILPYVLNLTCNSRPIDYQRKKVIPEASGKVLEIGIGPGSNLKHYDNQKVTSILGIDPSAELNQIAQKRAEKNNLNVEFLIESASSLSVESNSIDTVVSTYALCSIPEPQKTLHEIKRVLKDDGVFIFSEQDHVFKGVDKAFTKNVPGCENQPHKTIQGGHFVQEDNPEECIQAILTVAKN